MGTLLKKPVAAINYFTGSNLPVFRSNGSISSFTGSTNTYTSTPLLETTAWKVESAINSSVTMDMNIKSVTRTGRIALMVYSDWYGGTATAAYNTPSISIRFDNDGNFTAPWLTRTTNLHPGWNCIMTGREIGAAVTGNPIWTEGTTGTSTWVTDTMTRFRSVIAGVGANLTTRTYYTQMVDDVEASTRFVIRFDDAYESVYTIAFPIMQAFGFKGVLGVISSTIGTAGYMTWEQVAELRAAGWEIANHTKSHLNNDYEQNEAYWLTEIGDCSDAIETNVGVRPTTFISPFGNYLRGTASGYRSAVELLFDVSLGTTDANLGPCLLQGHYLPCHNVRTFSGGVNAAGHLARIDGTVAAGASAILMYHDIVTSGVDADTKLLDTDFAAQMAKIFRYTEAGFSKVKTMRELQLELGVGFQLLV